jgi:hypothetical protein
MTVGKRRLTACLWVVSACAMTPLSNRIDVGEEPYVIGVGEGPDGSTDLFAASASGGKFVRLTFTRAEERRPRLSGGGTMVAFFRSRTAERSSRWTVVVLDLRTSAERIAPLPANAGEPEQLGWSSDGATVMVRAGGYFAMDARGGALELRPVTEDSAARADSAVGELLGRNEMGMVVQCDGGGVCIAAPTGEVTRLGAEVTEAVRWGADSVAYFGAGGFEIRPLAGGRPRRPEWSAAPSKLRSISYHPGSQTT